MEGRLMEEDRSQIGKVIMDKITQPSLASWLTDFWFAQGGEMSGPK